MELARIRAGERDTFDDLVRGTWGRIVEDVGWVTDSRDEAEDCCQEAFIRLWEHRKRWYDGSARALVSRIARNLALDRRRRERFRGEWAARTAAITEAGQAPDELAVASEYEGRFRRALAALTPGRREVIELVRLQGMTHRQAAEVLGISPQTVANRMTLALADLRASFADILTST